MQGTINTVKGSSYRKRLEKDEDDSPFKIGGTLTIGIVAMIYASASVDTIFWGKADAYGKLHAEVKSGITCEGMVKASEEDGMYFEPEIKFHGIVIKGSISLGIASTKMDETIKNEEEGESINPEDLDGIHFKAEGEIIVMDAYEWELKDWRIPISPK